MTASAQQILNTFDQLPDSEQMKVGLEILKRLVDVDFPPLNDDDLTLNAETVFLELDRQESSHD